MPTVNTTRFDLRRLPRGWEYALPESRARELAMRHKNSLVAVRFQGTHKSYGDPERTQFWNCSAGKLHARYRNDTWFFCLDLYGLKTEVLARTKSSPRDLVFDALSGCISSLESSAPTPDSESAHLSLYFRMSEGVLDFDPDLKRLSSQDQLFDGAEDWLPPVSAA